MARALLPSLASAQEVEVVSERVAPPIALQRADTAEIHVDGKLDEAVWATLPVYRDLLVIEPDTDAPYRDAEHPNPFDQARQWLEHLGDGVLSQRDLADRWGHAMTARPHLRSERRLIEGPPGRIEIAFERCKACELCIPACPTDCIELGSRLNGQGYGAAVFARPDQCTGCALCAEACPDVAIQVWR